MHHYQVKPTIQPGIILGLYPPLSNALTLAAESLNEAHTKYPAMYQSLVGGGDTEEDRLLEQIQQGKQLRDSYLEVLNKLEKPNQRMEQACMRAQASIDKLQERLDKFYDFNSESAGIFSEAEANIANLEAAIAALGKGGAWNAASGTFDISRLDMTWSKSIQQKWKEREKKNAEKIKAYEDNLEVEYIFDHQGNFQGAFINGEYDEARIKEINDMILAEDIEGLKAFAGGFIDQWANNNGKDALNKLFGERQFLGQYADHESHSTGQFWGDLASIAQGGAEFIGGTTWLTVGNAFAFAGIPVTGGASTAAVPVITAEGIALAGHGASVIYNAWGSLGSGYGTGGSYRNKNGEWGSGSFDSIDECQKYHFKQHGKEVGAKNMDQYLRKAQEFARTVKKGVRGTEVPGATPGVLRFRKNGKYVDMAPDGSIVSFGTVPK